MNHTKLRTVGVIVFALASSLFLAVPALVAENQQANQENSEDLLLKIMDLHSQLVDNEAFIAQAKMIGAYLEAAQPLDEAKKVKIYATVLRIITRILELPEQVPPAPVQKEKEAKGEEKGFQGEQRGETVFVPGGALLEIFKADSIETLPKLPVIRTYWERDLAYYGGFLLPDRFSEIGRGSPYVARFSFYYEAKESGDYGFSIVHSENACRITVGGVEIVTVGNREPAGQGVCNLEKGFHRVEFWLVSALSTWYNPKETKETGSHVYKEPDATFELKVLTPSALDAVRVSKDMMLLKAGQKKPDQIGQGEKAKVEVHKPLPYIDD